MPRRCYIIIFTHGVIVNQNCSLLFPLHRIKLTQLIFFWFQFTDERDAIQKKTFTKWVNKHLRKVGKSFWYVVTICPEIFAADMDGRRRRLALLRSFAPSVDVYMTHLNMSRIFMGLFSSVRDSGSG